MSSYIPQEVITGILSKLDIQTLLRCRFVSKQWRSLIESNVFIKTHVNHSIKTNTNNTLFVLDKTGQLFSVDFDTLCPGNNPVTLEENPRMAIPKQSVILIGSCNGLLSVAHGSGAVFICNPWLKEYKERASFFPFIYNNLGMLVLDKDRVFGRAYGFGYDSISNDYKVVRIVQSFPPDAYVKESEMTIYSAKKDLCWFIKMPYLVRTNHSMGVYVGGALHWIVSSYDDFRGCPKMIAGFDLGVDEFREVPQPDYGGNVTGLDIGVLGGCLCMCAQFENVGVDFWVMREYGVKESWSKVFSISSKVLCYDFLRPLGYSKKGEAVLLELDMERLVWYDIEKKRVVGFVIDGCNEGKFEAILCLNSLFRPKQEQPLKKERKTVKKRLCIFSSLGLGKSLQMMGTYLL